MFEPLVLPATFLHLGHITPRPGWRTDAHLHDDYHQLIVVLDGTIETTIEGRRVTGHRGDLLHYARGVRHSEQALGERLLQLCFIHWQGGDSVARWPVKLEDREGRTHTLVQWIREIWPSTSDHDLRMINLLLNATLCALQTSARPRKREIVQRTKAYILDHLAEPLSLEVLAKENGLSKFHFSREFKKAAGVSPVEFLRRLRVEEARSLLLTSSWPLKVIAERVGFADEFQLSRVFRRLTGASPRSTRNRHASVKST